MIFALQKFTNFFGDFYHKMPISGPHFQKDLPQKISPKRASLCEVLIFFNVKVSTLQYVSQAALLIRKGQGYGSEGKKKKKEDPSSQRGRERRKEEEGRKKRREDSFLFRMGPTCWDNFFFSKILTLTLSPTYLCRLSPKIQDRVMVKVPTLRINRRKGDQNPSLLLLYFLFFACVFFFLFLFLFNCRLRYEACFGEYFWSKPFF